MGIITQFVAIVDHRPNPRINNFKLLCTINFNDIFSSIYAVCGRVSDSGDKSINKQSLLTSRTDYKTY